MWPHRIPLPSTFVLAAIALWLAAKIIWYEPELIVTPAAADAVPPVATPEPTVSRAPLNLAAYQATLDRPLFVYDRRPIPLPEPAAPVAVAVPNETPEPTVHTADHIALTGIVRNAKGSSVYLDANGNGAWVEVEGFFDGWQVIEVTSNKVTLLREDQTVEKFLYAP